MNFSILMAAGLPLMIPLMAAEKSGHASAELLCGVDSYQAGKAFPVAIRLKIEPGWHSYWINPGIGGMPLKATWTLPDGWQAGELRHPVPKRFMTGELPGFGYEGEAVYRVDLTPPAGATGETTCTVKLAWLTCDDSACVPGDAELSIQLPAGDATASAAAAVIEAAANHIPRPVDHTTSGVSEQEGKVIMRFAMPGDLDFSGCEAFPATPDVMDPATPVVVRRDGDSWTASAKKSEYADGPVKELDLVFAGGKLSRPVVVFWRGE